MLEHGYAFPEHLSVSPFPNPIPMLSPLEINTGNETRLRLRTRAGQHPVPSTLCPAPGISPHLSPHPSRLAPHPGTTRGRLHPAAPIRVPTAVPVPP